MFLKCFKISYILADNSKIYHNKPSVIKKQQFSIKFTINYKTLSIHKYQYASKNDDSSKLIFSYFCLKQSTDLTLISYISFECPCYRCVCITEPAEQLSVFLCNRSVSTD